LLFRIRLEPFMKTAKASVFFSLVLGWIACLPASAQDWSGIADSGSPPMAASVDRFGNRNYLIRADIGGGLGYDDGFVTFGAFQPVILSPDELILFANPRGIITNFGDLSANVGAGLRYLNPESERILGGSFWWDHDNLHDRRYDQFGISAEWLGNILDLRLNGYMPTNDDPDLIARYFQGGPRFTANNIGFERVTITDYPLKGADFEVGGALPHLGDIGMRLYAGGYYLEGNDVGPAYGFKGRLEALFTQDLWANVGVSTDPLFGTNVTAAVTWYLGTGQAPRLLRRIPMNHRLYQQVERNYRIPVYRDTIIELFLALRAGGRGGSGGAVGTPIFVVHVNNTAAAGGDGTFERPLNALPATTGSNVDIVFVHRGDGTSNRYDGGITLSDHQRLLGQGVPHLFTSLQGTFPLPGFIPGPTPLLTNPLGNVVTLANNNEVSGFRIAGAGGHGITGSSITHFDINRVVITGSGAASPLPTGHGINLVDATGTGTITDATLSSNNGGGLVLSNSTGVLTLDLARITANSNALSGISISADTATITATAEDTTTNNNDRDGISLAAIDGSTFSFTSDDATSTNNGAAGNPLFGHGLTFFGSGALTTATIHVENGTFSNNALNGLNFETTGGTYTYELLNNNQTITGNTGAGIFIDATDSTTTATIRNSIINGNGSFGIFASATNGAFDLIVGGLATEDINLNGTLDVGEDANLNGLLDRDGNIIDNNRGAGLAFVLLDSAAGSADIRGNFITRTLDDTAGNTVYNGQAIDIRLTGTTAISDATATLAATSVVDRNTIGSRTDATQLNAGGGIFVFADQNTTIAGLLIGDTDATSGNSNVIARNTGDGINFNRRNQAVIDGVVIADAIIENNTGDGIDITAANSSVVIPTFPPPDGEINNYTIRDSTIDNAGGRGIALRLEADARLEVDIDNVSITDSASHGIQLTELIGSQADIRELRGDWTNNEILRSGGNGIQLAGSVHLLRIGTGAATGNEISQNALDGIDFTGTGDFEVNFNTIRLNGGHGIDISTTTNNTTNANSVVIDSNSIFSNALDGVEIQNSAPLVSAFPFIPGLSATLTGNFIRVNGGRGVDILNQIGAFARSDLSVTLDGNTISGNSLEGVYVVNTPSTTQNQTDSASVALATDGAIATRPRMFFTMDDNEIEGNGLGSTFTATGLVMRVGTSDGGYGFTSDGGFFSDGLGGVEATITDNTFAGNLGDDVFFRSERTTIDPLTSAGTWDDTPTFDVTAYEGDPQARLDLIFTGNTFDSANVNNAGAFYNNDEPVFKSRDVAQTPAGPFLAGTRERNAQRLGGRFAAILPPFAPATGPTFRYPGLGMSTFRLLADPDAAAGFAIDDDPYASPFADSVGVFTGTGAGFRIEAMPYGWTRDVFPFTATPQ
jgi:hypothetical protein